MTHGFFSGERSLFTAGETVRLVVVNRTFTDAAERGIACVEPGHDEAGMCGTLSVRQRS